MKRGKWECLDKNGKKWHGGKNFFWVGEVENERACWGVKFQSGEGKLVEEKKVRIGT